ncbi:PepSY-associated TM helix domain-containing protein [Thermoflavimicrobium dichotomicum]|uniref:Uncharacterized iron-regulated membrane protein n=1 Tax=Thermoflavimicrobium dichotomicum TaxID=46223 RepID=A0A1I3S709_9BACL|nr:PepSY domain-containing protein [Thermoflavimicrobium dichotomicum]SFJ54170.1 Uncharacterized iron-regulated membrane protein [Thermoflavimicrobium dichotomicum]
MSSQTHPPESKKQLYAAIWRWHFYAGIIFAPFIIMLSVTGAIYLFKPQIENWIYQDYYYIQAGKQKISPSMQLGAVKKAYPQAKITSYKPSFEPNRTAEVGIQNGKQSLTVFVNPYNGKIVGKLNNEDRLMDKIEKLHGELMAGTIGDRLVELAACWAFILLITGLYLWWPREKNSLFGTIIPRLTKGTRTFWRDLHAVPAFWLSLFIVILILTGLPWSGLMGDWISKVATATNTGYPEYAFAWGPKPQSQIPTKDVTKVPWAAEQLPVPNSSSGVKTLSVEQVIHIADTRKVHPGYNIHFPEGEKGVYTISVSPDRPEDQATLHIDQYSGKVLADLRFKDYGPLAKAISIGIALHEGHYFGLLNQLLGLFTCIGLIVIAGSGLIMWWKRRPQGKLGAPTAPKNFKMTKWVSMIIIILGILFPLVGVSLLIVLLLDFLIIKRIPTLQQWVG